MDGDKGAKPAPTARIGDLLVERGLISKDLLEVAFQEKAKSNKLLGELLVDLRQRCRVLGQRFIDRHALGQIGEDLLHRVQPVPLEEVLDDK